MCGWSLTVQRAFIFVSLPSWRLESKLSDWGGQTPTLRITWSSAPPLWSGPGMSCVYEVLFFFMLLCCHAESFLAAAPVEVLLSCGRMRWMFLSAAQWEASHYLRGSPLAHLRGRILLNPQRGHAAQVPPPFPLMLPTGLCNLGTPPVSVI